MKKVLVACLSIFFGSLLCAQDTQYFPVGPFGYLNNTDDPIAIPSTQAQDLLNVLISPGGQSVYKREGINLFATLDISTSPVHGIYNFFDSSGNDVSLFFNDTRMSSSVSGNTPQVLFSTGTVAATYQCDDTLGFAYCANTARTSLIKTDGVTHDIITNVNSTGTMVAATPERLASAGFDDAPSRIDLSAANDFTNWTIGNAGTDPAQFTISAPGYQITHITYAFGRLMWFKDKSFGYIFIGQEDAQADWEIRTISPTLGTLDNSSVYWEGILYFRGQDGHIYGYDGANFDLLTRDLEGTISLSQPRTIDSWTQTSASDFNNGDVDFETFYDTTTYSNSMATVFPDYFNVYRTTDSASHPVWTDVNTSVAGSTYSVTITTDSKMKIEGNKTTGGGAAPAAPRVNTSTTIFNVAGGATFYFELDDMESNTDTSGGFYAGLQNQVQLGAVPRPSNSIMMWILDDDPQFQIYAIQYHDGSSTTTVQVELSFDVGTPIEFYVDSSDYQLTVNGSSVIVTGSHSFATNVYSYWVFHYKATNGTLGQPAEYVILDNFSVHPQTFTFVSEVHNETEITSWDKFTATDNEDDSITYSIRASDGEFTINSSTPSWTNITSGENITITTGAYFQVRAEYETDTSTDFPRMDDFTIRWYEGQASDKAYAEYFDNSIWWSVTVGTGTQTNNRVLYFDLAYPGWSLFDIATNGS
jgi:hypothetical protein